MVTAVIVAAGDTPSPDLLRSAAGDLIVAVDGGVAALRAAGVPATHLIGDLDSATSDDRDWAVANGAEVVVFPPAKDETDLELALDAAIAAGAGRLLVFGAGGGREDHSLGNWATLCSPRSAHVEIHSEDSIAHVVRGALELDGAVGDVISIVPWGGTATVTTHGLRWPLNDAVLSPFEALGISNEFASDEVVVEVHEGVAIVVRPTI